MIIKLIGVYFAYSAIVAVPEVISSVYNYTSLPSPPRFSKSENPAANTQTISPGFPGNPTINNSSVPKTETETPAEKVKNEALKLFLWNLFSTVFYGLIGWYLVRDGRFLFAILNREEPYDESGKPVEADSFPLSKKKEEVVTSLNLSGGKEEITSLNLSDAANEQATEQPVVSSDTTGNQTIVSPDTIENQPVVSSETIEKLPDFSSDINADAPDDALIEEINITPPDEQK